MEDTVKSTTEVTYAKSDTLSLEVYIKLLMQAAEKHKNDTSIYASAVLFIYSILLNCKTVYDAQRELNAIYDEWVARSNALSNDNVAKHELKELYKIIQSCMNDLFILHNDMLSIEYRLNNGK